MNKKTLLITSIILFSFIPSIQPAKAVDEWEQVERGQDYILNHLKGTDKYSWESAPTWINIDSQYVPYAFEDKGTFIEVRTGLIGAEIHRGKAVFYSPDMDRMAVGRETWIVFQRQGVEWIPVCASLLPYYQTSYYTESADFIEITGEWATQKGNLNIVYHFEENLKHTVKWTPNETGIYALVQFWNNTNYSDVTLGDGTKILRTEGDAIIGKTDSLTFLFGDDKQPFGVFENQHGASDFLHKTIFAKGTVNYEGITITDGVAWIFYNSTLCLVNSGETIEIDPDTSTFYPGDGDDDAYELEDPQAVYDDQNDVVVISAVAAGARYHGGVRFANVAIPRGASISAAKVSCYISSDTYDDANLVIYGHDTAASQDFSASPYISHSGLRVRTTASASWVADSIGEGYKDKTGLEAIVEEIVALGTWDSGDALTLLFIANSDSSKDFRFSAIEDSGGARKPKLYVEYTLVEIQVQYYTVTDSRVNLDANVNIDVQLNYTSDYAPVIDGTVTVNGISASHQETGTWRITQSKSSVQGVNYNTVAASGNTRGCSSVDQNGQSAEVVWDRYNVTQFWSSSYDLQTGDNATLYAVFESEYDSHLCDGDDSITIEDLQFTYDPIEEWFFAEVGKEEAGIYYFDTLNSIHENTYDITSGNLDYNLSIAWCDYHYEFYGLYYENGTYSGNVTVNAYFEDTVESFLLEYETTKNYEETPLMFTWELEEGGLRKFYTRSYNETLYLFAPFDEYSSYSFEIKDYSGQIGSANSYLESYEVINGTERMVERVLIRDAANPTTLVLQKYRSYRLQIRCETGAVYSFPHFTPAAESPPILIIHAIEWGDQIHYVGENIMVEFSRPSYTHIRINYKDEREKTTSIFVEVLLKNLTQVWNDTSTEQLIQFNWYDANETTDYLVRLIAQHEDFGEIVDSDWLIGQQQGYEDPPDESVMGDWPVKNLIGISMLVGTFCVFSAGTKSNLFGTFATVSIGYVLVLLNFLSTPYYVLHACMVITILWGLTGGRT